MRVTDTLRGLMALALAYAALGGIGLAMAIPPGYASPIFPAAGLALAVALHSRNRLLPGVWLGSCLLNVSLAALQGHLSAGAIAVAASIGVGALLQAALGVWLIQRVRTLRWSSLLTERDSLIFLALGGPAACVVSASVGAATLVAAGVIDASQGGITWWNWYVGDTIGVLVFAPLTLTWLQRSEPVWRERLRTVVTPMLLVLLAITAAFYATARWEANVRHQAIDDHAERLARQLENRVVAHREILSALTRVLEIQPDLTFVDFEHLTRKTLEQNPDLTGLSFNPVVMHKDRAAFEARMVGNTGQFGAQITERDTSNNLVPAPRRDSYVPVGYIAPLADNISALGFNIQSEPMRAAAIQHATDTGQISLTAPISLVQGTRKTLGVLALSPAYAHNTPLPSQLPVGFAVAVITADRLVDIATRGSRIDGIAFDLRDPSAPPERQMLFASRADADPPRGSWRTELPINGTPWRLGVFPDATYLGANRPWGAWLVGVGGMLLATLLQTLMFGMTGRTAAVRKVVEQQTAEIRSKNAALARSEELMRNAIEAIGEAFVIYDADDRLVYCNDRYRQLYSASAEAIKPGARFEDILRYGTERGQYAEAVGREEEWIRARLAAHLTGDSDLVQPLSDGRWLRICERKTPTGHIVGFRVDVTELYDAKHAAERANHAKSQFLATMSHELRTPMNGVLGMAQLLQLPDLSEGERQEYVQTILDSGHTLMTLLNDILDLSKIEAGRLELVPDRFDPDALLHEVAALFAGSAQQKGLTLTTCWQGPAGHGYLGDATRIRQMLANLVSNAIKFTERGSIHLDGEVLDLRGDTATLRFAVTDTGLGISDAQLPILFQPFSQGDGSITRRFGGTGLGLSIVRRLAVMMGGNAGVDSAEGRGSTFWITLQAVVQQGAADIPDADTFDAAATAAHGRVLVVEDNAVNRRVVASMLQRQGLDVNLLTDGQQAVSAITTREIIPDVVLMDCQMPVLDGYEATRQIRQWEHDEGRSPLPIIALTASAFTEDRDRCLAAGMNDYISKPLDMDSLQAALARWVRPGIRPTAPPATPTPTPASTSTAEALLIDRHSLEQRFDADPDMMCCALDSYLEEWESVLDALGRSLQDEDATAAHRHAHSIKGMAAAISGTALTEQARTLEMAAARQELALVAAQFDALHASAQALADAARHLRETLAGTAPP
ncbi:MAG: CHASE domain-containing protein [Rhodocyclaceae bacterium]|nr:CHASE domain-containing protein [Rhodocyclaceae bacterium]